MEVDFQEQVMSKMDNMSELDKIRYLNKNIIQIKETQTFKSRIYFSNLLSKVTDVRLKSYISYILNLDTPSLPLQKTAKLFSTKEREIVHHQLYKVIIMFCFLCCTVGGTDVDLQVNSSEMNFEQTEQFFKISSNDYTKQTYMVKQDYSLTKFTKLTDQLSILKEKIKIFSQYSVSNYYCYSFQDEAQQNTSDILFLTSENSEKTGGYSLDHIERNVQRKNFI